MKLGEYQRELEDARKHLDEVVARRKTLESEEQELQSVVRGWEAIIARERKQNGLDVEPEVSSLSTQNTGESDDSSDNKTAFVREYLRSHPTEGARPVDLKQAAKIAGISHAPSWPYGPLTRLKAKGEITKRKGRYYLADTERGTAAVVN